MYFCDNDYIVFRHTSRVVLVRIAIKMIGFRENVLV